MDRRGRVLAVAGAALVVLVLGLSFLGRTDSPEPAAPGDGTIATAGDPDGGGSARGDVASPFSTDGLRADSSATPRAEPAPDRSAADAALGGKVRRSGVAPLAGPVDVTALGRGAMSDDDFEALAARLASDPALLASLVDEFRAETDPERLRLLARLLGEVGGPEATALAAELVYSGDAVSRAIGLDLLRRVQPGNAEARDIVAGLLSNETEARTLLPTLRALSRPGAVDADARADLASRISLLSTHEDAGVRRLGLGVLARWSDGSAHAALFRDALLDPDSGVREAAAYALVDRDDPDGTTARELFAVIGNEEESDGTRRAAMLALRSLPLDDASHARAAELQKQLDRRPR